MSGNNNSKDLLGYSPEEYRLFKKHAWIVLIGFSILYCFIYCGRVNMSNAIPAMTEQTDWTELDLGVMAAVLLWCYGFGHLFNGRLGEIFGVRKFIVLGVILSATTNIIIGFQTNIIVMAVLWGFNGYFQSMLWSPGIALLSRWWPGNKRGFATGFANSSSGLGSAFAPMAVVFAFSIAPDWGWRAAFWIPIIFMVLAVILFLFIVKGSPEDVGLKPYVDADEERNAQDERLAAIVAEKGKLYPYFHLLKQWRFDLWLLIVFGSNLARYGLMTWMPQYYHEVKGYSVSDSIIDAVVLPLGMAIGTLVMPILSDRYFSKNRLPVVIICALVAATTVFFFPIVEFGMGAGIVLFFSGFFIYGINGVVWAYATDVGGRVFAGTAAGVLDCAAYIGAGIQAIAFGAILVSGNYNILFVSVAAMCILIAVFAVLAGRGLNKEKQREKDSA